MQQLYVKILRFESGLVVLPNFCFKVPKCSLSILELFWLEKGHDEYNKNYSDFRNINLSKRKNTHTKVNIKIYLFITFFGGPFVTEVINLCVHCKIVFFILYNLGIFHFKNFILYSLYLNSGQRNGLKYVKNPL